LSVPVYLLTLVLGGVVGRREGGVGWLVLPCVGGGWGARKWEQGGEYVGGAGERGGGGGGCTGCALLLLAGGWGASEGGGWGCGGRGHSCRLSAHSSGGAAAAGDLGVYSEFIKQRCSRNTRCFRLFKVFAAV
jgi:hypothetical protein